MNVAPLMFANLDLMKHDLDDLGKGVYIYVFRTINHKLVGFTDHARTF